MRSDDGNEFYNKIVKEEAEKKAKEEAEAAPAQPSSSSSSDIQATPQPKAEVTRRYDSLGWLMHATCGAAAFDPVQQQLILASNNEKQGIILFDQLQDYLIRINKLAKRLGSDATDEQMKKVISQMQDMQEEMSKVFADVTREVENSKRNSSPAKTARMLQNYGDRFQTALEKVTWSVISYYLNPQNPMAFPQHFIEGLNSKGKKFFYFASDLDSKPEMHAEMRILDVLVERGLLVNPESGQDNPYTKERIYFGVSKKCCFHCEGWMRAVNKYSSSIGVELREEMGIIETREAMGHRQKFPYSKPAFLNNKQINTRALIFSYETYSHVTTHQPKPEDIETAQLRVASASPPKPLTLAEVKKQKAKRMLVESVGGSQKEKQRSGASFSKSSIIGDDGAPGSTGSSSSSSSKAEGHSDGGGKKKGMVQN